MSGWVVGFTVAFACCARLADAVELFIITPSIFDNERGLASKVVIDKMMPSLQLRAICSPGSFYIGTGLEYKQTLAFETHMHQCLHLLAESPIKFYYTDTFSASL